MHPDDQKDVDRRRRVSLGMFARALEVALCDMPMGYPGATNDRNRFAGPIEQLIEELRKETA